MFINEKGRKTEVFGEYDVVVAGGGIAGISAAISSARNGAKTLLIEREYLVGGLATLGLVTIYLPLCDGLGNAVVKGIGEELLKLSISKGAEENLPTPWQKYYNGERTSKKERSKGRALCRFNASLFSILCERLLVKEGVKILYGTDVVAVKKIKDKITHVIVENKTGRSAYKVKSVVDATGDAILSDRAGAKTESYKRGNILASWYYKGSAEKPNDLITLGFSDSPDNQSHAEKDAKRYYGISAEEISNQTIDSHETLLKHFLKDGDLSNEHTINTVATIPQMRMTRRIVSPTVMTEDMAYKRIKDSVGTFSNWKKIGPVYELPFSALYSVNVKNLIAAGRNVSADDMMWDVTRVIPVCAVSGEAAGLAASMTDNFKRLSVSKLQRKLKDRGIFIHNKIRR